MKRRNRDVHIRLEKLRKNYPNGTVAVDGLDLDIYRGETLVLIGPSGCGKTTTLRMMNRLIEPSGGSLLFDGEDTLAMDPVSLRLRMGYVIQGIGLFPHMSIFDNVAVVPRLKGVKGKELDSRVERSLEMVGLPRKAYGTKKPGELSGGQKQRIGVARALAGDPELILMDEPFGALDPITREVLQDELLKLKRELKKTIIFVTHDIHEAMKMGDRVAIMKQGRLVQVAEPLTLLSRPADNFVRDFVGADNVLSQFNYMRVRNIGYSRENIPVVDENSTFGEAREAIQNSGIPIIRKPYVYVTNLEGKLLGVVEVKEKGSDDDEIYHFIRSITPVNEEGTVFDALQIMVERGAATVPIVDEKGFLKGLLTFGQLNSFISSEKGRS